MAERLVDAVTDLWENVAFNRLSLQDESVMRVLREYLDREGSAGSLNISAARTRPNARSRWSR